MRESPLLCIASYTLCQQPEPCPLSATEISQDEIVSSRYFMLKHKDLLHSHANCKLSHTAEAHPKKGMRQQTTVMITM